MSQPLSKHEAARVRPAAVALRSAHGIKTEDQEKPRRLIWLMLLTAATLLAASIIHFGPALPINGFGIADQFDSAAAPEAILGILLAASAAYLASGRSGSRELALAATIFTLLLSLFGLSLTLPAARAGDVVYHLALVVLLGGIIVGIAASILRRYRSHPAPPTCHFTGP